MNKEIILRFRVTLLESETIKHRAEKTNLTISDFCRNSIFNKRINYALSEEEEKVYKNLTRFNNDFERLANYFKHKDPHFSTEIRKIAQEIKVELRYIRDLRNGRKSNISQ